MTDDLSAEHAVSKTVQTAKAAKTPALELLEQGGITRHWDALLQAVRESTPGITDLDMADVAFKLRSKDLFAFALWLGEEIVGFVVLQSVVSNGLQAANVHAISGKGISLDQWKSFIKQCVDVLRMAGYNRLVALTDNPRILQIVKGDGWKTHTYCERDVL